LRAPKWNRGPDNGPDLPAGSYRVRLHVDGATYAQPLTILPDPQAKSTLADRARHVAYLTPLYDTLSRIDTALNEIDNLELQLPDRIAALGAISGDRHVAAAALVSTATAADAEATREAIALSSHPVNDQDNDFLEDLVRERLQSLIGIDSELSPTAEQLRESAAVRAEASALLARHAAFMRDRVVPLEGRLTALGVAPLDLGAKPVKPAKPNDLEDEHASKRGDD
jgi:hypothetical protein